MMHTFCASAATALGERRVPWIVVYIREAHAVDEWTMGQPSDIAQHKTLEDRRLAAIQTQREIVDPVAASYNVTMHMVIDAVTTGCGKKEHYGRCGYPCFERLYHAWPLVLYVMDSKGIVHFISTSTGDSLSLDPLMGLLESLLRS